MFTMMIEDRNWKMGYQLALQFPNDCMVISNQLRINSMRGEEAADTPCIEAYS
jgi:hypothetical protein